VVDQQSGWVEIRLYSRPNGSTGWVPLQDVTLSTTSYRIVVSVCARTLTLYQGADVVYSSPVGVGRPQWPTPIGPSFVDAIVATPRSELSIYGPTVVMLGTHSNVLTDFEGGDGVVAIHGYPSDPASTRGVASSHGCIRSSPTTVDAVKVVPVGTPVDLIQ
jgi:lipoprotein-anchoring transpeptidase ErfK/SrfK